MAEKKQDFGMALSTAEVTFQNLDSSEISLTDVSHYFDSDLTNLVQSLRKDNKKPSAYIVGTTTANAQFGTRFFRFNLDSILDMVIEVIMFQSKISEAGRMNEAAESKVVRRDVSSGYEGVREIEKRLTNTVGWSATSGQVDNWVYEEANAAFIKDKEMLNRLMNTNPNSFGKMIQTFLKAKPTYY